MSDPFRNYDAWLERPYWEQDDEEDAGTDELGNGAEAYRDAPDGDDLEAAWEAWAAEVDAANEFR